ESASGEYKRVYVRRLTKFLKDRQNVSGRAHELRERALGVMCLQIPSETNLKNADQRDQETQELGKYTTPYGETVPKPDSLDDWSDDVTKLPDFSERELHNVLF
ncbi:hypothetical protein ACJMK2_005643, partial [Sinanodonta woodiana]